MRNMWRTVKWNNEKTREQGARAKQCQVLRGCPLVLQLDGRIEVWLPRLLESRHCLRCQLWMLGIARQHRGRPLQHAALLAAAETGGHAEEGVLAHPVA